MGENLKITSKGYLSLSDHDRMTRGITLHEEEAKKVAELLTDHFNRKMSDGQGLGANEGDEHTGSETNGGGGADCGVKGADQGSESECA